MFMENGNDYEGNFSILSTRMREVWATIVIVIGSAGRPVG